ncbi:hypothetical protein DDZ14_16090 [Maritimibacter sp. 55A14]|uniref:hypothetical protein n=1 Tax=Maritimibacter sp. 55A14 TaxID=2174844 RepID=UPI000D616A0B|nr:hypothetical protein [Maritimibacter sp. 55A14]PWE29961.1 hypothetical protein DDZ14_16090 [Maritimibacter sp. 55A14]
MRDLDPATVAHLATRPAIAAYTLFWLSATNRTTGAVENMGLWSGDDHQSFDIGGQMRLYHGAGTMLDQLTVRYQSGTQVQRQKLKLAAIAPEVEQALKIYEPRLAPVEIHRAILDADTRQLIGAPHRVFAGTLEQLKTTRPKPGEQGGVAATLASAMRRLTLRLSTTKSDEAQRRRGDDRFYRYADVSGNYVTIWGEKKA